MGKKKENEEITTFQELILFLEAQAESFPYLSDYEIIITPESNKPILIMNYEEFDILEKSVIGE